jgi:hypothetical protein
MEQWNDGILGPFVFHLVEKYYGSWNKQTMDPKNHDPDIEVMRFLPLFHCSIIPSFHVSGIKPLTLKDA